MSDSISLQDGESLVRCARDALFSHIARKETHALSGGVFEQSRSIFVTINTYPKKELRGCVGFVNPEKKLGEAVCQASIHAGLHDSRFTPISKEQSEHIIFEVSVLSAPTILDCEPSSRPQNIKIGKDGLILEYGSSSGLLLPQVAADWNFTPKDFLEALCQKAGLPKEMHKSQCVDVYTFRAQIFEETKPCGKIIEKKLFV